MQQTELKLSLTDFMQHYSEDGPFEILAGEMVPVTPQVTRSGRIAVRILRPLANHVDANALGEVFMDVPFVLTDDANWVKGARVPDVMFVSAKRLQRLQQSDPDWESKPLLTVPELVVEVVSPTDTHSAVRRKTELYLADGVALVWVVEPDTQTVTVYRQGSDQQTILSAANTLAGEDVVPGFTMPVSALFS